MNVENILTIVGFFLVYGSLLIIGWINVRIKIKEIDVREQLLENDVKELKSDIKEQNCIINNKLDDLISRFDDFRVDIEKRIKN